MPSNDLSLQIQQQYELLKSYMMFASVGCAVLIIALYVAASALWSKQKQGDHLNAVCRLRPLKTKK
jgi:hypothetical protein